MNAAEIRQKFLQFFESKGHTIVPSSSLVVSKDDPTLYFTNSGMVQFKDVFLGKDIRPYNRATTAQRSLRAGGKHNDLENVGFTSRHHTFFEMLGNFSFGDYFKRDAILYAWELLTVVYALPADKLWVTVYQEDEEAYNIWSNEVGVPAARIVRIGDNKGARYASDNFWQMADIGPCGPCSEIFFDHGPEVAGGPPGSPDSEGDRYIEVWNLVFMQFDRAPDGTMNPLPKPCVDTGMGMERLAAVLQHVHSNYEIDLFQRLIAAAGRETGVSDLTQNSLRVIADHIRACGFLVADGVIPGNFGPGYVLRRIIRRAIRHGYKLGCKKPFFSQLVGDLVREMGDAYPLIREQQKRVTEVLAQEESRFFETLENGMEILDKALAGLPKDAQLDGETAFKLHDTFGFPLDLTGDVCRERNLGVDELGFNAAMERQRHQARSAAKFKMDAALVYGAGKNTFTGYTSLAEQAKVVALYVDGAPVQQIEPGNDAIVVLDTTPFYAESGGQVGDAGRLLSTEGAPFVVDDTQKIQTDVFGHHGQLASGLLRVGDSVAAQVDTQSRLRTQRNHSVTHLMHKALREVLGAHVEQKGSLVNAQRTRFDFAHTGSISHDQVRRIEVLVNNEVFSNAPTVAQVMSFDEAVKGGATALFGEKYGDSVRVLDIGSSRELCGGTHVTRTGDIGLFKIVAQSGVAAGIRRVEAVTGDNALSYLQQLETQVDEAASLVKSAPADLNQRIAQLLEQSKAADKELAKLKAKMAVSAGSDLASAAVVVGASKVLAAQIQADPASLRDTVDQLKNKLGSCAVVLACVVDGKVSLVAGVSTDLIGKVKAGDLVNAVALQVGGKGGGRPDMAMAGGTDATKLEAALLSVNAWVAAKLGA
jgi:alanyl-tRNA synthetase